MDTAREEESMGYREWEKRNRKDMGHVKVRDHPSSGFFPHTCKHTHTNTHIHINTHTETQKHTPSPTTVC